MNAHTSAISPQGRAKAANKRDAEFLNRNVADAPPPVEGRAAAAHERLRHLLGDYGRQTAFGNRRLKH